MLRPDKTNLRTLHIIQRSAKLSAVRVSDQEYDVTCEDKSIRTVTFYDYPDREGLFIDCYNPKNDHPCPANAFNRHCSHVEAAVIQFLKDNEETKPNE